MSYPNWTYIAHRLEEEMYRQGLSSQALADKAGVDRKTIDRMRRGEAVRRRTLSWVETALGTKLITAGYADVARPTLPGRVASRELGSYAAENFANYVGHYYGFRYSYDSPDRIICFLLDIAWSDEKSGLIFTEKQHNRAGKKEHHYEFRGVIAIPAGLGVLHFLVIGGGAARMASATLMHEVGAEQFMRGVMIALGEVEDVGFFPVTSPMFLTKLDAEPDDTELGKRLGAFEADNIWHKRAKQVLEEGAARFCAPFAGK